jgi:Holliday junction resolvase-like predicted endonuclease
LLAGVEHVLDGIYKEGTVRSHCDDRGVTQSIVVALVAAVIALWLARVLRRWRGSLRARRRAARAGAGEDAAALLLADAGFTIVERQARVVWAPLVDGEPVAMELRVDYLVERDGELLVAEVKTGEEAPSVETAATRRQLLEYHVAFAADGVLLVSPERGTIQRVVFPQRV